MNADSARFTMTPLIASFSYQSCAVGPTLTALITFCGGATSRRDFLRPLDLLDDIEASRADLAEAFIKTFIVWSKGLTRPFSLQQLPIFTLPNSASGQLIPVLALSVVEQLDESGYSEGDLALGVLSVDSAPLKLPRRRRGRVAALLAELVTGIRDHDVEAFASVSARENLDRSEALYCLFCIIVGGLTALSELHNVSFEEETARFALLIAADEAPVVRERLAEYFR
jgi:hypothetical protein